MSEPLPLSYEELLKKSQALERRVHELEARLLVDSATGIPNKDACLQWLEKRIAKAPYQRRSGVTAITVVFIDLNGLRALNSKLGHIATDRVLADFAQLLKDMARDEDIAGRRFGRGRQPAGVPCYDAPRTFRPPRPRACARLTELPAGPADQPQTVVRRPQRGAMEGIWYVVGFAFAGVSFVFLTIGASWLISHRTKGSHLKGLPYESGIPTYGDTHGRFGVSYYIYALLFVAFDIEVIFIFLWALVVRDPIPGLITSMAIFVLILLLGLGYAWRKGVLTWR